MTSGSVSPCRLAAKSEKSPAVISRDNAQTAIPRTTGDGSPDKMRQRPVSPASPELPAAIRQLRTNRLRPIRLTGEPERKRETSDHRVSAERTAAAPSGPRALSASFRMRPLQTCSTDRRKDSRRSHRCGCRSAGEGRIDRPLMFDRQIGDATARIDPVWRRKRIRRTGVKAGAAGAADDPAPAYRSKGRPW